MTTPGGGVIVRRSEGDFAEINFHPDGTYHENRHSGLDAGESYIFPGSDFAITVEAEILVTGVCDPDSRMHGIDESLDLGDFGKACLAEALLLARLGEGAAS